MTGKQTEGHDEPQTREVVLGLSAAAYPLTDFAIRRFGRRGAVVTEVACCGLAVRDAAMVVAGVPDRLRPGPAILLWMELTAALPRAAWTPVRNRRRILQACSCGSGAG